MDLETNRTRSLSNGIAKTVKAKGLVQESRLKSENSDKKVEPTKDVPSIRLSPEQIEEIHTDEYTLTLFYATRMEPMTLLEMKRQFVEPESKKAQSVMDRFIKAGLVHITPEGKYYSNFPENYINYSDYRYDNDLEAKKDAKVFQIMKEQTGKLDYWKDKTYFSMDAFYSDEQTQEMQALFKQIKNLAKVFANENGKKKNIKGLKFRRMKFYDMTFSILFALFVTLSFNTAHADMGGNDPVGAKMIVARMNGGNDPTGRTFEMTINNFKEGETETTGGGGGHDPSGIPPIYASGGGHDPDSRKFCLLDLSGQKFILMNEELCQLQNIIGLVEECQNKQSDECDSLRTQLFPLEN